MNIFPNEMTNSPARSYASTRPIPTLSSRHENTPAPHHPHYSSTARGARFEFWVGEGWENKKDFCFFFPQNDQQGRFFLSAALIVTVVLRLKKQFYSNCVSVPTLRTVLTCDHAVLLPFLFWRREEKDAWYIYFTRRSFFPFSRPPIFPISPKNKSLMAG